MSKVDLIELVVRGGDEVVAVACGTCRVVAHSREAAAACCAPRKCETCGQDIGHSWCKPCSDKRTAKAEQARVDKATKVPAAEYSGPLFTEEVNAGDYGEGYFSDEAALRDACDDSGEEMPVYAWACKSQRLTLDAGSIVEDALENQQAHEGAGDAIPEAAMAELEAFVTAWAEKHGPTSWRPDYSRAVVFAAPVQT